MLAIWLLVLLFAAGACSQTAQEPDSTRDGPCECEAFTSYVSLPDAGHLDRIHLRVHTPAPSAACPWSAGPACTVWLFPGFELSGLLYNAYAERLASWGFAVVQYDLPLLHVVHDEAEVGFLPALLEHLEALPALAGRLNTSCMATAGHSRGAKIAALHLAAGGGAAATAAASSSASSVHGGPGRGAGAPLFSTAFLIDPVDSTAFRPASPDDPSAVDALAGLNRRAAITAAGITGPCNPADSNFRHFWDALGSGWLETVTQAGHMQFADPNPVLARALDLLCHAGNSSHQHVIDLTLPPLVAWMHSELRLGANQPPAGSRQPAASRRSLRGASAGRPLPDGLADWVEAEEAAGEITFETK